MIAPSAQKRGILAEITALNGQSGVRRQLLRPRSSAALNTKNNQ
jgi:hypothetical protein